MDLFDLSTTLCQLSVILAQNAMEKNLEYKAYDNITFVVENYNSNALANLFNNDDTETTKYVQQQSNEITNTSRVVYAGLTKLCNKWKDNVDLLTDVLTTADCKLAIQKFSEAINCIKRQNSFDEFKKKQ